MEIKHPTTELSHIILDLPEWHLLIEYFRKNRKEVPLFQVSDARLISENKVTLYVYSDDMDKWDAILKEVSV